MHNQHYNTISVIPAPFPRHSPLPFSPSFPPFPRHSRAGGNQLCARRKPLRRQSRRESDGDFISPSFPRLRESTLLPFCYLRESANGDLSPKMANPCGGKAAGNFRRQRRRIRAFSAASGGVGMLDSRPCYAVARMTEERCKCGNDDSGNPTADIR